MEWTKGGLVVHEESQLELCAAAESAYAKAPWNTTATGLLAGGLMRAGDMRRAEDLLRKLLPGDRYGAPMGLVVFHVVCGEMDQAAVWAAKAVDQRDPRLVTIIWLLRAPSRDILRLHGGWSAIARQLEVPVAAAL
jgi:hypothetical protein